MGTALSLVEERGGWERRDRGGADEVIGAGEGSPKRVGEGRRGAGSKGVAGGMRGSGVNGSRGEGSAPRLGA